MIDKIEIKYDQNIIEESKDYNQTSGRTMIIPTNYNLNKLEDLWTKYNSQHKQLKREADWKSLELFGLNNQDHYEYLKTKYTDTIVPSDICANNNLFEFANIKSKDVEEINESKEAEYVYHGSSNKISNKINPNMSFHKKLVVYASPMYEFALCYAGNPWNDFTINQSMYNGTLCLTEIKQGAFKETFDREGYIYYLDPTPFESITEDRYKYNGIDIEVASDKPTKILKTERIPNILNALENSENIVLYRYPKLPKFITSRREYLSKHAYILYKNFDDQTIYDDLNKLYPDMNFTINESEDKSYIDKNHKQNGHKKLSDFKLSKSQNKDEGKSYNLSWIDENNKTVGKVRVDTVPASDGYRWFGDLEVSKNYRGYGLGNQILKFVISEYKAGALAVYKDNQIAYNMYKKYGFEVGKNNDRDNNYYYMYLKNNREKVNSSPKLEMSSFEYGCSLLENTYGIKRDITKLNLSLYEAKNLPESLRKEKVLGAEDPEENVGGFTLNRTRVDYPALPPDELLDLGVFSDDNYYAEYKALKIDENYCSKDWFDAYQKMCVGIYTEETDIIMKARHVKLMELCNELSKDPNNNQLKQYILELGWNPELPYTSGNRALVSRNTRNKLNRFYNEFSFINVEGIEDISYIDEEVDEDSALYPVYIVLLSSKTAFGKMIKKATNSIWTHGAISFDSKLDKIYSYARDGFVFENLDIYGKDSKLSVNVIFLNKKDYIKMKSRLDYFIANKKHTRYGFDNLLNVLTGKIKNHDLNLICTEFVDKLFKYIGIDLTHKSSNLVTPEDFSKTVKRNKKIYTVYNGFTGNYNKTKVDQRIAKLKASGRVFRELFTDKLCDSIIEKYTITPIVEVKEFPVQFDKEGNLLIKNIKKINFNEEYNKSHKLLREYEKTGNIDGMKYEISKLWFMYHLLEKYRHEKRLTKVELKVVNDSRARIFNDFQKYLRIIQSKEKDFNFNEYYENSPFSDSAYKFNASTIKYTKDFIKSLII